MQRIHDLLNDVTATVLGPDAARITKLKRSVKVKRKITDKNESTRKLIASLSSDKLLATESKLIHVIRDVEIVLSALGVTEHAKLQVVHARRKVNTRLAGEIDDADGNGGEKQDQLQHVKKEVGNNKDAISIITDTTALNPAVHMSSEAVALELPKLPRGRGRPHGSTTARNAAIVESHREFGKGTGKGIGKSTRSGFVSTRSGKSNVSNSASTNKGSGNEELTSNSRSPVEIAVSNSTSTAAIDKMITIGARYGYPSPPALSTYNGKFGRSFYSSPYNASTPILPNSQVAYSRGGPNSNGEWILCRVLKIISETRFEILDPEPDQLHPQGQVFKANYREVILVPLQLPYNGLDKLKQYKNGTQVLAQYPETTTFYRAEVVETKSNICMLRFEGEEDSEKLTPVERVFVLPYPK